MRTNIIVEGAHEIPEVTPPARIVVHREGDRLPSGYFQVLYRVIPGRRTPRWERLVGPHDILLVRPMPGQRWWEHSAIDKSVRDLAAERDRYRRYCMGRRLFTQPICNHCYVSQVLSQSAHRLSFDVRIAELCCCCGQMTGSGLYVRVDPHRVPWPTAT